MSQVIEVQEWRQQMHRYLEADLQHREPALRGTALTADSRFLLRATVTAVVIAPCVWATSQLIGALRL